MPKRYPHTRRKRIKIIATRRKNKRYNFKGGHVLGKGADGCVLTQYAWPCTSPLAGYDPSDPSVISKLVHNSDNEDTMLDIASSILKGPDAKFMVEHIGTCKPESPLTKDVDKQHQILDSLNEIMDMYKINKVLYNTKKKSHNGCTTIATVSPENIDKQYKIIVNKKYTSDLYNYIQNNLHDVNIVKKIIYAAIPLSEILQKLIKTPDNKILNIDLHHMNIFVNINKTIVGPNIQLGIADFGRCVYMVKDKDLLENLNTWYIHFDKYILTGDISVKYSQIPLEVRLLNYMYLEWGYLHRPNIGVDVKLNVNTIIWDIYSNKFFSINKKEYPDPLNLITNKKTFSLFKNYYAEFINHIYTYLYDRYDGLSQKMTFINILLKDRKMRYVIDFLLHRFITSGFLSTIITAIWYTPEFIKEMPNLEVAVDHFIEYNKDTSLFKDTPIHRLIKLYYTELLRPYTSTHSTIEVILNNEEIYDFNKVFATELGRVRTPTRAPPPVPKLRH